MVGKPIQSYAKNHAYTLLYCMTLGFKFCSCCRGHVLEEHTERGEVCRERYVLLRRNRVAIASGPETPLLPRFTLWHTSEMPPKSKKIQNHTAQV